MKFAGGFSIGQFIPGESFVHSLDPRCKIAAAFVLLGGLFASSSPPDFIPWILCLAACSRASRIRFSSVLRSGRPVLFLIVFTVALNLFWTPGREIFRLGFLRVTQEGLAAALSMGLRLYLLVMFAAMLMMTTSPMSFSDGLERLMSPLRRLRFPVSEMAMMMTIALRFIPTLFEETDRILKAQISRGADFESGGILKRTRAFIPVLVPLFVLVFARAENLATAMESRCYVPGAPRTRLNPLEWSRRDTAALVCSAVFVIFSLLWNRHAAAAISSFVTWPV
ncbi:MAG: energy-coupling factor transporter transmembrane protein EcfT [Synergistaceae bacterium]|jgi:energy-coupling factor transport system permease protein|nr:energy-coupling factor transporter transmembrane protein EcfT [Synergistaceae bacterium]